jgi:hypothetical protein
MTSSKVKFSYKMDHTEKSLLVRNNYFVNQKVTEDYPNRSKSRNEFLHSVEKQNHQRVSSITHGKPTTQD